MGQRALTAKKLEENPPEHKAPGDWQYSACIYDEGVYVCVRVCVCVRSVCVCVCARVWVYFREERTCGRFKSTCVQHEGVFRQVRKKIGQNTADCHGYNYTNGFITGINSALISLLPVISSKWRRGEMYSSQKKMIFLNRQNLPDQDVLPQSLMVL